MHGSSSCATSPAGRSFSHCPVLRRVETRWRASCGGWKASGIGRELGRQGLDAFRRSTMVVIDHKPVVQDWWYPYPDEWFRKAGGRKHV